MATNDVHPLEAAAARALEKADALGERHRARWLPDEHCWIVASSREGEPPKRVVRKRAAAETIDPETGSVPRRQRGYWWFVTDCDCEAAQKGYAVCWHKAAVYRWWQANRRVDGDAYGTLAPHSPVAVHANNDLDADGIERFKDRHPETAEELAEWERRRCWEHGWCDGYEDCGRECDCTSCDLARRGVPLTSPDVDFDPGSGATAAMVENTRRLLVGEELPW